MLLKIEIFVNKYDFQVCNFFQWIFFYVRVQVKSLPWPYSYYLNLQLHCLNLGLQHLNWCHYYYCSENQNIICKMLVPTEVNGISQEISTEIEHMRFLEVIKGNYLMPFTSRETGISQLIFTTKKNLKNQFWNFLWNASLYSCNWHFTGNSPAPKWENTSW